MKLRFAEVGGAIFEETADAADCLYTGTIITLRGEGIETDESGSPMHCSTLESDYAPPIVSCQADRIFPGRWAEVLL